MKKEQSIKVLRVQPHCIPDVIELGNDLRSLQKAVGGHIEIVGLESGAALLLNEEGKLLQMEPNRRFGRDILVGVFYVVGSDSDSGELTSLSDELIQKYKLLFLLPETITQDEVQNAMFMELHFE
jgi:hypothetical protein